MKLIRIITVTIFVLAAQFATMAQETAFGKKLAEDFWKALEEKRYVAAKTKLDSLKRKEPDFDASKMEKALADAAAKKADERDSQRSALLSRTKASSNLDELFSRRSIQADSGDTLESINAEIEKYTKMAEEVASIERASISGELERSLGSLHRDIASNQEAIGKLLKLVNEATAPEHAETSYYELLLRQSYWQTAKMIFPDDADILKTYEATANLIKGLGKAEERKAKAEKNLNARIDSERLPKALIKDAALEKIFQNVFLNRSNTMGLNRTFLRAVVVTQDYGLVRHSITGIILARYRIGAIAFKEKDGKCKQGRFRIDQDYVGGSFSGSWRGDFADFTHEMRCENVNK